MLVKENGSVEMNVATRLQQMFEALQDVPAQARLPLPEGEHTVIFKDWETVYQDGFPGYKFSFVLNGVVYSYVFGSKPKDPNDFDKAVIRLQIAREKMAELGYQFGLKETTQVQLKQFVGKEVYIRIERNEAGVNLSFTKPIVPQIATEVPKF